MAMMAYSVATVKISVAKMTGDGSWHGAAYQSKIGVKRKISVWRHGESEKRKRRQQHLAAAAKLGRK